ncbi:MAG: 2-succinyl-5-enolpyruvyl-6-hydroxy-3-cyclohexene-1-carboxylate synthase, partial [Actinomycetota bacterium]
EPLLPEDSSDWLSGIKHKEIAKEAPKKYELQATTKRNVLIVGHDRAGFEVGEIERLASDLAAVLIVEDPLRFKTAIAHAPILLSDERVREELAPDLAVIIGRTTLSRATNAFIKCAKRTVVIDPRAKDIDSERSADEILWAIPIVHGRIEADEPWIDTWSKYEQCAKEAIANYPEWSESALAAQVAEDLEEEVALFVSSSRPIRDLEAFAKPRKDVATFANRGLAGIDGNISTAMGIATHFGETYA